MKIRLFKQSSICATYTIINKYQPVCFIYICMFTLRSNGQIKNISEATSFCQKQIFSDIAIFFGVDYAVRFK